MPNLTIYPYLLGGTAWVFDDERHRLKEEAFILGTDEIIARIVEAKAIPNSAQGVALTFGPEPFDCDVELNWIPPAEAAEARRYAVDWLPRAGNWYRGMVFGQDMVGWICPALFLYFAEAPRAIYVKIEPLPAGVKPIWHVDPNDPTVRRFVSASGKISE
jgi:hypothetical protein